MEWGNDRGTNHWAVLLFVISCNAVMLKKLCRAQTTTQAWKQREEQGEICLWFVILGCARLQQSGALFAISDQADLFFSLYQTSTVPLPESAGHSSPHPHNIFCCCKQVSKGKPEGGIWKKVLFFKRLRVHEVLHWKQNGAGLQQDLYTSADPSRKLSYSPTTTSKCCSTEYTGK